MGLNVNDEIDARIKQLEDHISRGLPRYDKLTEAKDVTDEEIVVATIRMDGIILEAIKSHRLTEG